MSRFAYEHARPSLDVSVIVPVFNEILHIESCLESLERQDLDGWTSEILVVDGGSDDGTRDVLARRCAANPRFRMIDNPARRVSAALNAGMRASRGRVLARMDAHALYRPDYLRASLDELERTGASAVGGVQIPIPGAATDEAKAIALVQRTALGMGGASHRRLSYEGAAESLPYGVFHRDLLERVGGFDEDLFRTEDNDFFQRVRAAGGTLWLSPRIQARYLCRPTLRSLARQSYTTGTEIVPTMARNPRALSLRHLVPGAAALSGLVLLAVAALGPAGGRGAAAAILVVLGALYAAAVLAVSARLAAGEGLGLLPSIAAVYPSLHGSYGLGTLVGALRTPARILKRKPRRDSWGAATPSLER